MSSTESQGSSPGPAGWDPHAPGSELFVAIEQGDPEAVRELLAADAEIEGRDPRSRFLDGGTPLIAAASMGRADLVRLLLDHGAAVNARSTSGWTALMRTCNAGSLDCARLLLDAGADTGIRNDEGYTALGRVPGNRVELLRLLREHGAPVV
ncbi:ankyrin repeat domain-containing protein [Embleya sp. NPDC001921]